MLVVELVDMAPADFGFTAVFPGFGLLADLFPEPFLVTWRLDGAHAHSDELPGFAVPADPFPGTIGVAPSEALLAAIRRREDELAARVGLDLSDFSPPPLPAHVADGLGLRPLRQRSEATSTCASSYGGARLFLPVHVPGALLSLGDCHYAQGDGEVCGSAIEIGAEVTIRVDVAHRPSWRPRFPMVEAPARPARRAIVTTGIPVTDASQNELLDLGLAARRALLEMIDFLETVHGVEREAAYALCSVAADLRIAQAVDLPNALVSLGSPARRVRALCQPGVADEQLSRRAPAEVEMRQPEVLVGRVDVAVRNVEPGDQRRDAARFERGRDRQRAARTHEDRRHPDRILEGSPGVGQSARAPARLEDASQYWLEIDADHGAWGSGRAEELAEEMFAAIREHGLAGARAASTGSARPARARPPPSAWEIRAPGRARRARARPTSAGRPGSQRQDCGAESTPPSARTSSPPARRRHDASSALRWVVPRAAARTTPSRAGYGREHLHEDVHRVQALTAEDAGVDVAAPVSTVTWK